MQSIIHKLGFIAVLVTTVLAFEVNANAVKQLDNTISNPTPVTPQDNDNNALTQIYEQPVKVTSEQVSEETIAIISNLNQPVQSIDSQGLTDEDDQQVNSLLNQLHETAMSADWDTYFSLYHPDAIFIGTDASERWNMVQFKQYATPTKGWRYDLQARHLVQIGDVIVFDEQLFSPAYGISRGTGALVSTEDGWKIAQYHLSFPIPNAKAKRITSIIMQ